MKCLVLAGGKGDRLWPLSRENYPKQFIPLQKNHSLFQETIARNLPFCDEFIISANLEHEHIIRNQMKAFQGVTYRLILEEERKKTAPAILLAIFEVEKSEIMLVVPSDSLISGSTAYRNDILKGKEFAKEGYQAIFGMETRICDTRYGYIKASGNRVKSFKEKPDENEIHEFIKEGTYLINGGIFIFQVGRLKHELKEKDAALYEECRKAFANKKTDRSSVKYTSELLKNVPEVSIEKAFFEKSISLRMVKANFEWKDINSLDDLHHTDFENYGNNNFLRYKTENINILNIEKNKLITTNDVRGLTIINTEDVLYVGKTGSADNLKEIVLENRLKDDKKRYFSAGNLFYRQWGRFEKITRGIDYEIRKIFIYPGKTIYVHSHEKRKEHWIVLQGKALATVDGVRSMYEPGQSFNFDINVKHQLSNIGKDVLVCLQTDIGELAEKDTVKIQSRDLTETELGFVPEPVIKLEPAYKDALWGGSSLKRLFGKACDFENLAETWELSAHPKGQSRISMGRHRGMLFADYLQAVGKDGFGWKSRARDEFPILIKFIDARKNLSVQVHPGDEYAMEHENEYGKNEMWYVLEAEPDAHIYCGFNKNTSRIEVEAALADNTIEKLLNRVPVKKGDVFFIEAGTVHAILAGTVICEVQQSSDCTYRLYDYDRRDEFGNTRELHTEKALDVLNYSQYLPQKLGEKTVRIEGGRERVLGRCKYFESVSYTVESEMRFALGRDSFVSLLCVEGNGEIMTDDPNGENSKVIDKKIDEAQMSNITGNMEVSDWEDLRNSVSKSTGISGERWGISDKKLESLEKVLEVSSSGLEMSNKKSKVSDKAFGISFKAGDSLLIPDGHTEFRIIGRCEIVCSWV